MGVETVALVGALGAGIGGGVSEILGGLEANQQAKRNARMLERLGVIEAEEVRRETRDAVGAQRAAIAASGGDPTVGSAVDITAETSLEGELEAQERAFAFDLRAAQERQVGQAARTAGIVRGVGTILGTGLTALGQTPQATPSGGGTLPDGTPFRRGRDFRAGHDGQPF